jgi:hypothetical protein
MIVDAHAQQARGFDDLVGDLDVGPAGLGLPRDGCGSSYDLLYHIEMQAFFLSDSRGGAGIGDRHLVRYCDSHERSSARAVNSFDARRSIQSLPAQASISPIRWSIWSRPRAGSG